MSAPRQARTAGRGRFYVWGRGERYWSVTTILGALPKDALKFWAAKTVAEFAVDRSSTWLTMSRDEAVDWLKREPLRYTGDRADFGSAVHAAAEAYVVGKPVTYPREWGDEERKAVGYVLRFFEVTKPTFVATEASVFSRAQKYAGTLDGIADFSVAELSKLGPHPWEPRAGSDTVRLLLDYKTGGDLAERKGVYPDVALQLAAYANADFVGAPGGHEVPLPGPLDGAAVVHVNAGGVRLVPVDALRDDVFRSFLYVREVFRWLEVVSKDVLGAELVIALAGEEHETAS